MHKFFSIQIVLTFIVETEELLHEQSNSILYILCGQRLFAGLADQARQISIFVINTREGKFSFASETSQLKSSNSSLLTLLLSVSCQDGWTHILVCGVACIISFRGVIFILLRVDSESLSNELHAYIFDMFNQTGDRRQNLLCDIPFAVRKELSL